MRIPHLSPYVPEFIEKRAWLREFVYFGFKQAWACIFGGLLLFGIVATGLWYPDVALARYDFLFLYAVAIQLGLVIFRMESWREVGVIAVFHAMATAMELFKTSEGIGSWSYPEDSVIRIGNVPLFAGFMYGAVGSYMARAWRIFGFRFTRFPPLPVAGVIAVLAYFNFFSHHYMLDIRWILIVVGGIAFARCHIHFTPKYCELRMNLLLGFVLVAMFIWIAENLGTLARAWQYPNQRDGWQMVHHSKFTAWYLLMQLSFILIVALRRLEARLTHAKLLRENSQSA
ncbi:MAG: DUF817 domain-containing protein [Luteolibacter sp.]